MVAQAWRLKGKGDSTLHYLQLAEALPVEVTVEGFRPGEHDAVLSAVVSNPRSTASPPLTLTFEFLSAKGEVVATLAQEVAAIAPGANVTLDLKPKGAGIVAWRYKR